MILRIAFGRLPSGTDADALVELRGQLARAARGGAGTALHQTVKAWSILGIRCMKRGRFPLSSVRS